MNKIILGIDESGRGSILGDLVMYGVMVRPEHREFLKSIGVKDSKKIVGKNKVATRVKRKRLARVIKEICQYSKAEATPTEIDKAVKYNNLNVLERQLAEQIIKRIIKVSGTQLKLVVLDGHLMFEGLTERMSRQFPNISFISTDKAESKYLAVAAASICAKADRDTQVQEIMGNYFDNGAGYPNDGTAKWIRENINSAPIDPYIRKSWSWYTKLMKEM